MSLFPPSQIVQCMVYSPLEELWRSVSSKDRSKGCSLESKDKENVSTYQKVTFSSVSLAKGFNTCYTGFWRNCEGLFLQKTTLKPALLRASIKFHHNITCRVLDSRRILCNIQMQTFTVIKLKRYPERTFDYERANQSYWSNRVDR